MGREQFSTPTQAQSVNRRPRSSLSEGQSRETFAVTATTEGSTYGFVEDPVTPGEQITAYHVEGQAKMPYQPSAGRNLEVTKIRSSCDVAARVRFAVNGQLVFQAFVESGGYQDVQQAGGFELAELVSSLDGSHTVMVTVENLDDTDNLEGTVFFRALEEEV